MILNHKNNRQLFGKICIYAIRGIVFSVLFTNAITASASDLELYSYMNKDLSDLPEYCKCRVAESHFRNQYGNNWPRQFEKMRQKWIRVLGKENWAAFHHYCYGIMRLNEYHGIAPRDVKLAKKALLGSAINTFEFMRHRATSNFPLLYRLHMYEYQTYMTMKQYDKAQISLQRALGVKKKRK